MTTRGMDLQKKIKEKTYSVLSTVNSENLTNVIIELHRR